MASFEIENEVRQRVWSYAWKIASGLGVVNVLGIMAIIFSVVKTAEDTASGVAERTVKSELGEDRIKRFQESLDASEKLAIDLQVQLRLVQKQLDAHKPYREAFEQVAGKLSEQERDEFLKLVKSFSEDKARFDPSRSSCS